MADDPNPVLRAELEAARALLLPQIRGMADMVSMRDATLTGPTRAAVQDGLERRERRKSKIDNALHALDIALEQLNLLEADGYPSLPKVDVKPDIFRELQEERSDIEIATGEFEPDALASSIAVTLGTPAAKS